MSITNDGVNKMDSALTFADHGLCLNLLLGVLTWMKSYKHDPAF